MRLNRRWWVAIAIVVIVMIALSLSNFLNRPSEECKPVIALLEYNKSQGDLIDSKATDDDPAVPTQAEETAYQQWADGLAQRAQEINDPNLAATAIQVADAAAKFVSMLPRMRAESENHAPGAPPPPSFFEMTLLNKRITDGLQQLSDACD
ncbi:hypothetical protein MycrhN_2085 [Mycolicibacterium rhodesiae NBB3]|uniref:Uncharacterized protein n=1 Tax=Mycolicibacterium rhodesiae (strain NBB3) TaxID=710685 RepID=G8RQT2_MYCRN|nr:hypothetical protein [Mycolicibacterium rhodesiae]AEV72683.1 hypothetical protein MycrhN_2085 [Mycolicibacterium rhodesiae NBB3]